MAVSDAPNSFFTGSINTPMIWRSIRFIAYTKVKTARAQWAWARLVLPGAEGVFMEILGKGSEVKEKLKCW
jgi:hypothetical protein